MRLSRIIVAERDKQLRNSINSDKSLFMYRGGTGGGEENKEEDKLKDALSSAII